MTDTPLNSDGARPKAGLFVQNARTRRRNRAEARFRAYGLTAILIGLFFLVVLAVSIIRSGAPAFTRTVVDVEFTLSQAQVDEAESQLFKTAAYQGFFVEALKQQLDESGMEVAVDGAAIERIVGKPGSTIREFFRASPDRIGTPVEFQLAASSRVDGYFKGRVARADLAESRFLNASDLDLVDALAEAGIIHNSLNWTFITGADSGVDNPGGAGIGASVVGSFFMMLVVLVLSLPIGVAASIYLEEFAPQNRFTDIIEVNISNLAAVPSIVFGILGLAVFIQFAHLPQSAPLVGGLVLTLMTLPTIIISTRASLRAVRGLIAAADQVLAVGTELGPTDYDMYGRGGLPDLSGMIRIDADADQLARHLAAVTLQGDAATLLAALAEGLVPRAGDGAARAEATRRAAWDEIGPGYRAMVVMLDALRGAWPGAIVVGDSTQPVYAGNLYYDHDRPGGWFNAATGYGALGYGAPVAIGAALAAPDTPVVCLTGDGGLQFSLAELMTARDEGVDVTFVVWNNHGYGEIAEAMAAVGAEVLGCDPTPPDFADLARACGLPHQRITADPAALAQALMQTRATRGPAMIEVIAG